MKSIIQNVNKLAVILLLAVLFSSWNTAYIAKIKVFADEYLNAFTLIYMDCWLDID